MLTEDSAKPDGTEVNDTTTIISTDTAQAYSAKVLPPAAIKLPLGFYRVKVPCVNCPEVEQTVYFERNKTFLMEETDPESHSGIVRTSGSFNPAGSTVWAYKGQVVKARYTWGGDTLYYLLPNGKRLRMQKVTAAIDNDAWKKKGKEGLVFFGIGNEPFWNLEINQQEHLAFHQAEWTTPLQFDSVNVSTTEDSLVYTASLDSASIKAVIYNRFCSDGMSDYIYPNSIKVEYNGKTFKGCGIKY
ncbi:copper resistance protein NlpE N-terminal domain-containing protein [Flavisolibacter tropicus]|uniref:Uncharacterized protein n=1 Tax=Flavisolibacter tropicus TaxID=1492898 RepID=A0A172TX60_9BACT|nr:copper resistance protein NlpE N-terminal domain-containing protein [Flavisolibacter tropicus]ANE51701.1 hypothetical protein SY85_15525 [Flavisolibacter tropicus]